MKAYYAKWSSAEIVFYDFITFESWGRYISYSDYMYVFCCDSLVKGPRFKQFVSLRD